MLYYLSICFWYPIYLIYLYTVVNIFVHNIRTDILDSFPLHFYLGEFFEGMIEPTAARWPVLGFKCVLFLMMRTAMPCEVGYPSKWSIELQYETHMTYRTKADSKKYHEFALIQSNCVCAFRRWHLSDHQLERSRIHGCWRMNLRERLSFVDEQVQGKRGKWSHDMINRSQKLHNPIPSKCHAEFVSPDLLLGHLWTW